MPRRESEPITRLHLNLFDTDIAWLRAHYGDNVGMAKAVRRIIRNNIKKLDEQFASKQQQVAPLTEEELEKLEIDSLREIQERAAE